MKVREEDWEEYLEGDEKQKEPLKSFRYGSKKEKKKESGREEFKEE